MDKNWFDNHGNLIKKIPKKCIIECSHRGDCENDVKFWVLKLKFHTPKNLAIKYLQSFGTWDDLDTCSEIDLNCRVLWLATCELKESGVWFGLTE